MKRVINKTSYDKEGESKIIPAHQVHTQKAFVTKKKKKTSTWMLCNHQGPIDWYLRYMPEI